MVIGPMEVELRKDCLAVEINRVIMKMGNWEFIRLSYRVKALVIATYAQFSIVLLRHVYSASPRAFRLMADTFFNKLVERG